MKKLPDVVVLPSDTDVNGLLRRGQLAIESYNPLWLDALDGKPFWKTLSSKAQLNQLQLAPSRVRAQPVAVLDYLVRQGLDPHAVDQKGRCMLHYAFVSGVAEHRHAWIKALLERGVSPVLGGYDGRSALAMAAIRREPDLLKWLIEAGYEPTPVDHTAVMESNCKASLDLFWNTFGFEAGTSQVTLDAAFWNACLAGRMQQVDALLDRGANPLSPSPDGRNPLQMLFRNSLPMALAERLISLGVDATATSSGEHGVVASFQEMAHSKLIQGGKMSRRKWRQTDKVIASGREDRLARLFEETPVAPTRRTRL